VTTVTRHAQELGKPCITVERATRAQPTPKLSTRCARVLNVMRHLKMLPGEVIRSRSRCGYGRSSAITAIARDFLSGCGSGAMLRRE